MDLIRLVFSQDFAWVGRPGCSKYRSQTGGRFRSKSWANCLWRGLACPQGGCLEKRGKETVKNALQCWSGSWGCRHWVKTIEYLDSQLVDVATLHFFDSFWEK